MVRFKVRYLLAEVKWEDDKIPSHLSGRDMRNAIMNKLGSLHGDWGAGANQRSLQGTRCRACTAPCDTLMEQRISTCRPTTVKYFNAVTGHVIVRCARNFLHMIWSAMTGVTLIKKTACALTVQHVSGL
jgi:RNase P/RNase MRP subunit POP5